METIKDKINKAFRALRKAGYVAHQNWQCCQSCGCAALPDGCKKYVFYHSQDADNLRKRGSVHLAWDGDGTEIATILQKNGLKVNWNGSRDKRMEIFD
jgi:hypothetical protein